MAVVFNRKEVNIEETTVKVTVPDDDVARLMYYLNSMCTVLGLESTGYNISRLKDYNRYHLLTSEEIATLVLLCGYISPDELDDKCIFHSEEVCGDMNNRFYRVNSKEIAFAAANSVFVGATQVSVKKIMVYKMAWIRKFYIDPMTRILRLRQSGNRAIESAPSRPAITTRTVTSPRYRNTTKNNSNWIYSSNSDSVDCCTIL